MQQGRYSLQQLFCGPTPFALILKKPGFKPFYPGHLRPFTGVERSATLGADFSEGK
jgi:hypothetical protein